jgi:hypothetical protein
LQDGDEGFPVALRIYFPGLAPGRKLHVLSWAAFADDARITSSTTVHFGRELADVFRREWRVSPTMTDCDVVVYPYDYRDGPETAQVAAEARKAGKPCLFLSGDETLPPSQLAYGTLYRNSIFKRLPHERTLPVFILDAWEECGGAPAAAVLPWEPVPRIGFCGYTGTRVSRMAYRTLGSLASGFAGFSPLAARIATAKQKAEGLEFRAAVLDAMQRDNRLRCEFIPRAQYLGYAPLAAFTKDHPLSAERRVFLANLFACPYNLTLRGKGNHSVRFYEILSAGRIPLFVNTNCVLPLEQEIDWRTHLLWVEDSDLPCIGEKILFAHNRNDADAFQEMQARNRRMWQERLRPEPFFRHVLETLAKGGVAP